MMPSLPDPNFGRYGHGSSLLSGWFPIVVEIVTVVVVLVGIGWRTRRWRLVWIPVSAAVGVVVSLGARTYMNSEGLASDPAPFELWVWTAVAVASVAVAILGFWHAPSGSLPDQIDAKDLAGLRNTHPDTGKVVPVDIPDSGSGFKHRQEFVYLPPSWFTGPTPARLPAVMMIAGEFSNPTTLTKEVRPYVISQFGVSPDPASWAVVGWSAGGTCAIDLAVVYPELFTTFEDIGGDRGPNSGTKAQTIERLYGGNGAALHTPGVQGP
jgi:hypothetical protein